MAAVVLVAGLVCGQAAQAGPHALYIVDANTGQVLADQNSTAPRFPASLTKMMTLYLAFDALEQGRVTMKTRIKISQAAANAAPSKLELAPGDDIALEDAIHALVTKSANDIAIAIAEHIGGSEANFARLMTAKAHQLGMASTTFRNASGLPDPGQTTTARDMVTLGIRLYDDFPRYFPLFSTRSFSFNGSTYRNHNTLMLQMPGINGIKTGYTHASGFNLVSSYQNDGKHVIGAIFGGETAGSRNAQMRLALTRAMARASATKTRKPVLVAQAEAAKAAAQRAKAAQVAHVPAPAPARRPELVAVQAAPVAPAPASAPANAAASAGTAPAKVVVARVRPLDVGHLDAAGRAPVAAQGAPQVKAVPQPAAVAVQPVAPPVRSITVASTTARPPSTLDAQLKGMGGGGAAGFVAQPNYHLNGPPSPVGPIAQAQPAKRPVVAAAGPVARGGGFAVQVGAYGTPVECDRQLASVAAAVPGLAGHAPERRVVQQGGKTLYRARFAGFDHGAAQAMCAEIARRSIPCLAVKAD